MMIFLFLIRQFQKKLILLILSHLLNIQSINDFQKKINKKIEASIFRGNICIDGIDPWKESEWIGKTIKIDQCFF